MTKKSLRINDSRSLAQFLSLLAEESVMLALDDDAESERKKQNKLADETEKSTGADEEDLDDASEADDDEAIFADDPKGEEKEKELMKPAEPEREPEPEVSDEEPEEEPRDDLDQLRSKKVNTENIDFLDIIDQLNRVRSGHSLKNRDIRAEMEKYFEGMSKAEQTALYSYLQGISDILVARGSGDAVTDPSDPPWLVQMKSKRAREKEAEQGTGRRIARDAGPSSTPAPRQSAPAGSGEDTTPPIRVGEQVNPELRMKLRKLMQG